MMIEKGMYLMARTKTKEDVFGNVLWEVLETGIISKGKTDGVKLSMLGGSGPAARKGYTVLDTEGNINAQIELGVVTIVPADKVAALATQYTQKVTEGGKKVMPRTGCVEIG